MTPLFDHTYLDNHATKTLVLLHGNGGSKSDFLFLDDALDHSYNLLSLQGNVLENGLSRFFKRISVGVFDQQSILDETSKMQLFISDWCDAHTTRAEDLLFLGYSNGANMILATLFYYPLLIKTSVLLHPMLPFTPENISLAGHSIFITNGSQDQMVPKNDQLNLVKVLQSQGATPISKTYQGGHGISPTEMHDITKFLND